MLEYPVVTSNAPMNYPRAIRFTDSVMRQTKPLQQSFISEQNTAMEKSKSTLWHPRPE